MPLARGCEKPEVRKTSTNSVRPLLALNEYTAVANNSTEQKVQIRPKSWSVNSQRISIHRAASNTSAIGMATIRKPVCQPQKSNAALRMNGGGLMREVRGPKSEGRRTGRARHSVRAVRRSGLQAAARTN